MRLAIPAALKHFLDILQILIDMIMVGALGVGALAAVGLSMQFMMIIQAIMSLYIVGSGTLIARYIGSGRYNRASSILYMAMLFAIVCSFIIGASGWIFASDFFRLMGSGEEVIKLGTAYFQILCLGMGLIFLDALAYNALSSAGDTRSSLYIKIISACINGCLNYLFIFGHGGFDAMGVQGAAYATLCAYIFNLLVYGWILRRSNGIISFLPRGTFGELKKMIHIGIPATLERLIGSGSFLLFVGMIASCGTHALAGYQIGLRVEALAFMPGFGFAVAAMALAGQYIGAKNYDHAYMSGILSAKIAIVFMGTVGIFLVLFPEFLVSWFTKDNLTIMQASIYLRFVGIVQIPLALTFVLSGALRGAGATMVSMRITVLSLWIFRLIPSYIALKLGWGIVGIYSAMSLETLIKGWLFWRVYRKKEWLALKI
ncbi:MAG: MATE family efflux transporter [Sulfuricurvum sp.]|nr:MATE family efflux transporter [Sulfuricurvum sp.]